MPCAAVCAPQGKLKPFLEGRPQLLFIPDDGRQHVVLTPAGAILGGGTLDDAGAAPPRPPSAALPPVPRPPTAGLASAADAGSPRSKGASGSGAAAPPATQAVAVSMPPGAALPQAAIKDYKK